MKSIIQETRFECWEEKLKGHVYTCLDYEKADKYGRFSQEIWQQLHKWCWRLACYFQHRGDYFPFLRIYRGSMEILRMSKFWKSTKIFLLTQMGKVLVAHQVESSCKGRNGPRPRIYTLVWTTKDLRQA